MPQFVLFNAPDQSGMEGLWMTDGTAAGTIEIAPIANAGPLGVNPQYLTNYYGEMLFEGRNGIDSPGLWVTNGTSAGTSEITGISGANPQGLGPGYMQVYNGVVLLRGEAGVAGRRMGPPRAPLKSEVSPMPGSVTFSPAVWCRVIRISRSLMA